MPVRYLSQQSHTETENVSSAVSAEVETTSISAADNRESPYLHLLEQLLKQKQTRRDLLEIFRVIAEARTAGVSTLAFEEHLAGELTDPSELELLQSFQKGTLHNRLVIPAELSETVTQGLANLSTQEVTQSALAEFTASLQSQWDERLIHGALLSAFMNLPQERRVAFTADAIAFVSEHSPDMHGLLREYQNVVSHLKPGAVLVDANQNNRLDSQDKLLSPDGSFSRLSQSMLDDVVVRSSIVASAKRLDSADNGFASNLFKQTFNDAHFDRFADNGVFDVDDEVAPSDAMLSLFGNEEGNRFDCATGSKRIIQHRAALELLGPAEFDRVFHDLMISPDRTSTAMHVDFVRTGGTHFGNIAPEEFLDELVPGDVVYFGKEDPTEREVATGWSGEWATYLGDHMFYGFPVGIKSYEGMGKYGKLRHAKYSITGDVLNYKNGGQSNNMREHRRAEPARIEQMKKSLHNSSMMGFALAETLLETAERTGDAELKQLTQQAYHRTTLRVINSETASAQTGFTQAVIARWRQNQVPSASAFTLANIRAWAK